jgi:TonB-dependent starch-binding outer membrane protein SusC
MILANMRKGVLLLLTFLGFAFSTQAQTTVTGKVTDKKGDPVPGVTITVKGAKNATSTNNQGVYTLNNVASDAVLRFTGAGFTTQEIGLNGKTSVNAEMDNSVGNLNEVVVVGYGTKKVKDATGSVAALSTKDFNKGQISTPEQMLQGRTPGVIVTPSSGEPGAAATITIRGSSSIRGNQEPLYVVDGVPISGGGTSGTASGVEGSSTPKNPLMFLNPNDIESISILKDASSAAIYGSRGANGVILITTKTGKSARGSFTFSAATSLSKIASRYDLLNAEDFLVAVKNANIAAGTKPEDAAVAVANVDHGASTDWQDQIFRTGVSQNYNLGWGISKKSTAVRISGSYDDQKGIIKNSSLKRLTGRLNITQKFLNDKLKFDLNGTYSNVKNQYPPLTNNAGYQGSLMGAAIAFNPTNPIYKADGSFYDPGDGNRNPSQMLAYFDDNDNINRLLTSISGSYEIFKGLTYKATFGYDKSESERLSFADPRLSSGSYGGTNNVFGKDLGNGIQGNGRGVKQNIDLKSILVEHTVTYGTSIGSSTLDAVAGYSYQSTEYNYKGQVGWGLNTPVVAATDVFGKDYGQFKNYFDFIPDYGRNDLQSFFGRVNYTILDKYLLTATVRIDGSSKFGKDNRYGTFPAFAAKWRVVKENFAANSLGKVFSDFSIRANWGKLGSQDGIGNYDAITLKQTYALPGGQPVTNILHQANTKLKWEEATTSGAGLDFTLVNNRLSGTIDYYYTKRRNILFNDYVPGGFSATSRVFTNLPGYVLNKGWEFSLNYKLVKTKNFSWDVNYNMTFLHNEVRDLKKLVITGEVSGQGLSGAYAQTIVDGYPLFTWKMPVFLGFDGNGYARYSNGSQDQLLGSALPTFLAGLTNNFTIGRLSASVFMNASTGFYVYNNTANALLLKGSIKTSHNIDYATANSPESPINPGSVSSRFLEKGDFLRISNVNVSYAFNIKGGAIKTLSAFVSGQNLALFTNYSGLDPEVNVDKQINGYPSRGFDYAGYPKARTFTLGINLGF